MKSLSPIKKGRLMGHTSQVSNAQNVNQKCLSFADNCSWHFPVRYTFYSYFPSSCMTSKPPSHVTIACRMPDRVLWVGFPGSNHGYLCLPSQWCCGTVISACQTGWGGFTDCTGGCSSICTAWGQPGTPPPHPLLCVLSLGAMWHLSTWNPTSWCDPGCRHVLLLFFFFLHLPWHNETTSCCFLLSKSKHVLKPLAYQKCILCFCFIKISPDFWVPRFCPISSFLVSWCH